MDFLMLPTVRKQMLLEDFVANAKGLCDTLKYLSHVYFMQ